MSWVGGRLDGADYATRLGWRNVTLVALTLGWPLLLGGFFSAAACRGPGCGVLALALSLYVKPLVYIIFVLSLLPIVVPRLRDAGVSRFMLLPLGALLLTGIGFWTIASAPWSVGFMLGAIGPLGGVPPVVTAAFAVLVALAFLQPHLGEWSDDRFPTWLRLFVGATAAVVLLNLGSAGWAYANPKTALGLLAAGGTAPIMVLARAQTLLLDAVPLVAVVVCYRQWEEAGRPGSGDVEYGIVAAGGALVAAASVAIVCADLAGYLSAFGQASSIAPPRPGLAKGVSGPANGLALLQVAKSWLHLIQIVALLLLPFAVAGLLDGDGGAPLPSVGGGAPPSSPSVLAPRRDAPRGNHGEPRTIHHGFGRRGSTDM